MQIRNEFNLTNILYCDFIEDKIKLCYYLSMLLNQYFIHIYDVILIA